MEAEETLAINNAFCEDEGKDHPEQSPPHPQASQEDSSPLSEKGSDAFQCSLHENMRALTRLLWRHEPIWRSTFVLRWTSHSRTANAR